MVFFSNPRSSVQAKVGTFIYKYDKHGRPRERSPAPPGFQLSEGGEYSVLISQIALGADWIIEYMLYVFWTHGKETRDVKNLRLCPSPHLRCYHTIKAFTPTERVCV